MKMNLPPESITDAITTPERYREIRPGIEGFRLVSATVTVTLLDDPQRARYDYACHLETTGDLPARYWCYHLPADAVEIEDLRAWDARGRLHPRLYFGEAPGARIEVRLRDAIGAGERYTFGFGYESGIRAAVAADGRTRTITYSDWVIFNIPCARLNVHIELPSGSEPMIAVPAGVEDEGGRLTWRVRNLRSLEAVAFTVAYRRGHRQKPAYLRMVGLLAAALLGRVAA